MEFLTSIPYYYLIISAVVCGAFIWIFYRAPHWGFDKKFTLDLALFVTIAGFIGARLTHVFYEYPEYYAEDPWRFFDFGRGGYVYYGALLTGMLAGWFYLRRKKAKPILKYFDFAAPVLSLGYVLGRLACFVSGCCYGPLTDGAWGMSIQDEYGTLHRHHPTPIYTSLSELVIFGILMWVEKRKTPFHGFEFFLWVLLHSLARFVLEFWRADYRGPIFIFSISQWISIFLFLLATYFLLRHRKKTRP